MSARSNLFAIVCLLVGLFVSVPNHAFATEKWIVMGSTVWTAQGNQLTLDFPDSSPADLRVKASAAGSYWIMASPQLTLGSKIKQVALCYRTPNPGSFINQVRLNEYILKTAFNLEDLAPIPESSNGTCYLSPLIQAQPQGALSVKLKLVFANAADSFEIGALGLLVDE